MPPLGRQQFEGLANDLKEPDGGFSVRVGTGRSAPSGYMVSQTGTEKAFKPGHDVLPHELQDYTSEHAAALSGRSKYFGGWHDPDTGEKDLDISRNYKTFVRGTAAMVAGNQRAMYDSHRWRSVRNVSQEGAPALGIGPDSPEEQEDLKSASRAYLRGGAAQPPEFLRGR